MPRRVVSAVMSRYAVPENAGTAGPNRCRRELPGSLRAPLSAVVGIALTFRLLRSVHLWRRLVVQRHSAGIVARTTRSAGRWHGIA